MNRKSGVPFISRPLPGSLEWRLADGAGQSSATHRVLERLIAVAYGLTYDEVVGGFPPYEVLLDQVAALVARSVPDPTRRRSFTVLDPACGIGTVAARLAREGYTVVGLDAVEHLVGVARAKIASGDGNPRFEHRDLARNPLPEAGTIDVLVSMHTLYWHPEPRAFLDACRRALKPQGHAVFLTYSRPARVLQTFREIRAGEGLRAALRSLRWLIPTAAFERCRKYEPRYLSRDEFHQTLEDGGFEVLESRETFLAGISLLAWARPREFRGGGAERNEHRG